VVHETRWRGGAALLTAAVIAVFWICTWLVGEDVRTGATALAAAAVAVPTLLIAGFASGRRVRGALSRTLPPPRSTVYETLAASRERRTKLAGVVLTGIVALLLFDRFTDGGGVMAGLLAGLLAALGAVDLVEARTWEAAEKHRHSRLFVLVRPDALTPRLGVTDVYEADRARESGRIEPSPFDLGV
jgi:hypothetical protein